MARDDDAGQLCVLYTLGAGNSGAKLRGGLVSKAKREIHNCWILVRATLNIKRRVHSHASVV